MNKPFDLLNSVNFADDCTEYFKRKNLHYFLLGTNRKLSKVEASLKDKSLSINARKSAYSFTTNKNVHNIPTTVIRNQEIALVDIFNFLVLQLIIK